MAAPYVALVWPTASEAGRQAAARMELSLAEGAWRLWTRRPGLSVWERPERPLPPATATEGAVIVGRRFGASARPGAAGRRADARPVAEQARALAAGGWGAYVGLLHDPADDRWWLFRDPSGALEAFTWRRDALTTCASGFDALPPGALPPRLGLDWRVIADWIRDPGARGGHPAFAGIAWVAPGDVQPVDGTADEAVAVWRPSDWTPREPRIDPGWSARMAETLVETVAALLEPYVCVATEASGGLDSSVVNAAIGRAGLADRVVAALHYVGDRREADERRWAQALGERWGLPLACVPRPGTGLDLEADFAQLAKGVRPPFSALDSARDRDTAERLRAWGAQALVTGKGGDALFFQMPTPLVLADLWQARGLAAIGHPLGAQVARWLRRSVWSVWREALETPPRRAAPLLGRFGGWALRDAPPASPHPWVADAGDLPPAKRLQIAALSNGQAALGEHRRSQVVDMLHPLLTQPMMELCLSIPSWELVRGGRDRALARDAFAAWLPPCVVRRRSKGGLFSWYARLVAANAPVLRAHLLDGVLADAGLLDRRAMERALSPDDLIRSGDGVDLMAAAALESWVRHWQTRVPDAPGAERFQA